MSGGHSYESGKVFAWGIHANMGRFLSGDIHANMGRFLSGDIHANMGRFSPGGIHANMGRFSPGGIHANMGRFLSSSIDSKLDQKCCRLLSESPDFAFTVAVHTKNAPNLHESSSCGGRTRVNKQHEELKWKIEGFKVIVIVAMSYSSLRHIVLLSMGCSIWAGSSWTQPNFAQLASL